MAFRELVAPDCGGRNPLMQIGSQLTKDSAHRNEGLAFGPMNTGPQSGPQEENAFVKDYLELENSSTSTFHLNELLNNMKMEEPKMLDRNLLPQWENEYFQSEQGAHPHYSDGGKFVEQPPHQLMEMRKVEQRQEQHARGNVAEFFAANNTAPQVETNVQSRYLPRPSYMQYPMIRHYPGPSYQEVQSNMKEWRELEESAELSALETENWAESFEKLKSKEVEEKEAEDKKYWEMIQNSWEQFKEDMSDSQSWLDEFSSYYDPYKQYNFNENNIMENEENPLEKGKAFRAQGDIPSAVLCFEVACKKEPENAEAWELLGVTQAENEMDPEAIAALKKSLDLRPKNMSALMALSVSYTNESLQSQALRTLTTWLACHPKYNHLVPEHLRKIDEISMTSSVIRSPELKEIQNLFLEAVKQNPNEIDADIQEALGILFSLSSEFDKAVDCFRAALQVRPDNEKLWNRLGASLANGNRSVEAVEAYQRALEIEPGFIRARYNVGLSCLNLKAYKEAAEHLLIALNVQATTSSRLGSPSASNSRNPASQMSDSIWSTLRMIISLMGKKEHLDSSFDSRDLSAFNKEFNITL